jgi:hypothetical protein
LIGTTQSEDSEAVKTTAAAALISNESVAHWNMRKGTSKNTQFRSSKTFSRLTHSAALIIEKRCQERNKSVFGYLKKNSAISISCWTHSSIGGLDKETDLDETQSGLINRIHKSSAPLLIVCRNAKPKNTCSP